MELKKGYKQTELGIIPEDWEVKELGEVCKIFGRIGYRGYTINDIVGENEGAITLSPSNIYNNKIDYSKCTYISWFKYEESPEIRIFEGDVILVKTGSTYGKTALIKGLKQKATINPQIIVFKRLLCNNTLFGYVVSYDIVQNQINSSIVGGAIPTLSQKQIASFKLPLPPTIEEQTAIANALTDIDDLISALEEKIEKKKNIKQGAMQELLKPKEGWVEKRLGDILDYEQPSKYIVKSTEYFENGIPVLTAGKTFILGYTDETNNVYNNLPVIIFDDFTTATKYVNFNFKVKSSAMKILFLKDKSYDIRFIYEMMQMIDFTLSDHKRYWISEFSNLNLQVPSLESERDLITNILSEMDKEIEGLVEKLEKYRMIKEGMMKDLLTGRIRLI